MILGRYTRRLESFLRENGTLRSVGYVFHPSFWEYAEHLSPNVLVYHAYDLFKLTPGWDASLCESERRLVNRADLLIASSPAIAASLEEDYGRRPIVLPNGADANLFAKVADLENQEPADIATVPRPRIGYTGNLNRKVDFPLIQSLASAHPDWQFVFVGALGNLDDVTTTAVQQCQELSNVHFLGNKRPGDLPHYVGAMDVNIMCYRTGAGLWSDAVYPLKMHEYFATGLPVVTSDIASAREFSHVLACARNQDEWETFLADALNGREVGTKLTRRAVAFENDWNARAEVLKHLLKKALDGATYQQSPFSKEG